MNGKRMAAVRGGPGGGFYLGGRALTRENRLRKPRVAELASWASEESIPFG
jgi:hypothetical protein